MYVLGDGKENKDIITEKKVCRVKIGFLKIFREEIIYKYKRYFVNIYHIHSIELVQSQKSMLMSFSFPQNNVFLFHSGFLTSSLLEGQNTNISESSKFPRERCTSIFGRYF